MNDRRRLFSWLIGLLTPLVVWAGLPITAAAYDSGAAARYADNWWNGINWSWPYFSNNDCTNFISQSLNAGGYSMVNVGSTPLTDDNNWWATWSAQWGWTNTNSWSVAYNHYDFELKHYPGGWSNGTRAGTDVGATVNTIGDLYFYDFGDGYGINHASIEVAYGQDPNHTELTGDLVDAHTSSRYHAIWSLRPYNAWASTTTVYLIHIDPANH